MMMPRDLQCVITHSLYNLSPAPYLNKHVPLPYNKYKHGALASGYYNVYRDTKDITDTKELEDAIRTQDSDKFYISLPYRSPFYGEFSSMKSSSVVDRGAYVRKLDL